MLEQVLMRVVSSGMILEPVLVHVVSLEDRTQPGVCIKGELRVPANGSGADVSLSLSLSVSPSAPVSVSVAVAVS
eukprot:3070607-Rhodomonas_salina.1